MARSSFVPGYGSGGCIGFAPISLFTAITRARTATSMGWFWVADGGGNVNAPPAAACGLPPAGRAQRGVSKGRTVQSMHCNTVSMDAERWREESTLPEVNSSWLRRKASSTRVGVEAAPPAPIPWPEGRE